MITPEMIERVVKKCREMNPQDWMSTVGLTPEAERMLRESAHLSYESTSSIQAIRMAGFQVGYELGLQQGKVGG